MTDMSPKEIARIVDRARNDQELARLSEDAPALPSSLKVFAHALFAHITEPDGTRTMTTIGASLAVDRDQALAAAEASAHERGAFGRRA